MDDGVIVLEQLGSSRVRYWIRWTVTKNKNKIKIKTTTPEEYFLTETFTAHRDELSNIANRLFDGYDRNTEHLVDFLGQIARQSAYYFTDYRIMRLGW